MSRMMPLMYSYRVKLRSWKSRNSSRVMYPGRGRLRVFNPVNTKNPLTEALEPRDDFFTLGLGESAQRTANICKFIHDGIPRTLWRTAHSVGRTRRNNLE